MQSTFQDGQQHFRLLDRFRTQPFPTRRRSVWRWRWHCFVFGTDNRNPWNMCMSWRVRKTKSKRVSCADDVDDQLWSWSTTFEPWSNHQIWSSEHQFFSSACDGGTVFWLTEICFGFQRIRQLENNNAVQVGVITRGVMSLCHELVRKTTDLRIHPTL